MDSLTGQLLIAVPDLPDSNFFRSVVMMLQHSSEGGTGVILNRPSQVTVSTVWDEVSEEETCNSNELVNVGGPVDGPLIALHTSPILAETEIIPGVFMSMRRDHLDKLVNQDKEPYRIFSGYSGWGPGQLETEIERGGWLTMAAEKDHIFDPVDQLWKKVCEHVGHKIMMPHFSKKTLPNDPSLN